MTSGRLRAGGMLLFKGFTFTVLWAEHWDILLKIESIAIK